MPLYEFYCDSCGLFDRWRSLKEASESMICPRCQEMARRVYTTPNLVRTPPALANMRYRAEKSAYEPEVVRQEHTVSEEEKPSQVVYQSHGCPWMIGH